MSRNVGVGAPALVQLGSGLLLWWLESLGARPASCAGRGWPAPAGCRPVSLLLAGSPEVGLLLNAAGLSCCPVRVLRATLRPASNSCHSHVTQHPCHTACRSLLPMPPSALNHRIALGLAA